VITVDASAILAILLKEPEAERFSAPLAAAGGCTMSPVNYWEVLSRAYALHGEHGVKAAEKVIAAFSIEIATLAREDALSALDAFRRYGKGRNPARLNLGDCFAYALAGRHGEGLLFKGDDFPRTDVVRVPV
jgi:ribonuclease VapC